MKRLLKVFFYCLGFTVLCILMQIIAAIPVTVIYVFLNMLRHSLAGNPEQAMNIDLYEIIEAVFFPSYILSAVLIFLSAWIIHAIFRKKFFERLSLKKISPLYILISFITGCSMQMPVSFAISLAENLGIAPGLIEKYSENIERLMGNQNVVLMVFAIGITAPFIEEIIFRGLILNQLRKNLPIPAAILIQALLFGVFHLNVVQGIYAFAIAILMGLFAVWFDSLLLPIAFHMGMNISGIILSELSPGLSEMAGMVILIVSLILVPVCTLFLYHKSGKETAALN